MDYYETGLLELTADAWFQITGRGHVATFKNGEQLPGWMRTPTELMGKKVVIDGKTYRVRGVETHPTPSYSRYHAFGLLIGAER